MKKLAILFLLATVLIGFSFGQISAKGIFEADNILWSNGGKIDPALIYYFQAAASKDLGPGTLGVWGAIPVKMSFKDAKGLSAYSVDGDDFVVGVNYGVAAGPGTLTVGLGYYPNRTSVDFSEFDATAANPFDTIKVGSKATWEPSLEYTGVEAGPAVIGVGLWYDFVVTGMGGGDKKPNLIGKKPLLGSDNIKDDELGVWISAKIIEKLFLKYKFVYGVGVEDVVKIAYLDANYQATDQIKVGAELDNTGKKFKAFQVKPYVEFGASDNLALGVYVKIKNILNDVDGQKDPLLTPGVWAKYTF